MATVTLLQGDCLEVLPTLAANSVDSIVCDPPYGLSFMGKDWDHGIPGAPFWEAALRVAKPGAMLLAFGGTRTFHRLTVAIEDAGWEIRDCLTWLYGSGFPKSHDISKGIDKAAGAEREVIGKRTDGRYAYEFSPAARRSGGIMGQPGNGDAPHGIITAPATDAARRWDGWGTNLKPSVEPIVWAMKPLREVGDCAIIIRNLITMETELCKHIASIAGSSSPHIQPGLNEARGDFAQMRVPTQVEAAQGSRMAIGAGDGISLEAAISGSTLEAANIALSMISLWRSTLEEALSLARTCTTEMASSLTTDLKTWSLSLSQVTLSSIIQAASHPSGLSAPVSNAARYFNVISEKLNAIHELIVQGLVSGESKLSPNYQPIIMAMKPLDGTFANNALTWGVAGINVDASRIGTDGGDDYGRSAANANGTINPHNGFDGKAFKIAERDGDYAHAQGRWPANLILDDVSAQLLDEQTGNLGKSAGGKSGHTGAYGGGYKEEYYGDALPGYGYTGGASRFFYVAKASKRDRDEGLEGMELRRIRPDGERSSNSHDIFNTPGNGRNTDNAPRANHHPTVKPTQLMRYLCRLVTPPNGLILDPFMGSGSTGKAAVLEGFRFTGIELNPEYLEIAQRRIADAQAQMQMPLLESA